MWFLWGILRVPWPARKTNKEVLQQGKECLKLVKRIGKKRRSKLLWHTSRHEGLQKIGHHLKDKWQTTKRDGEDWNTGWTDCMDWQEKKQAVDLIEDTEDGAKSGEMTAYVYWHGTTWSDLISNFQQQLITESNMMWKPSCPSPQAENTASSPGASERRWTSVPESLTKEESRKIF